MAKRGAKGRKRATTSKAPKRDARQRAPAKNRGTLKRPGRLLAHGCAFTSEIREAILGWIEAGRSRKNAAAMVGVGERTIQRWVERGRENLEAIDAEAEGVVLDDYGAFLQRLIQGEAYARGRLLDRIDKAGAKDWHADAWLLERLDHREYGRHHRIEGIVRDEDGDEVSAGDLLVEKILQIHRREARVPDPDEPEGQ